MSSKIESNISKCVEEIWTKYDKDSNGHLDKDEVRQFIKDLLSDNKQLRETEGSAYNDAEFEETFRSFDKDGSGSVDKEEMAKFIGAFAMKSNLGENEEDENENSEEEIVEILMLKSSTKRCNSSGKPLVNPEELISDVFAKIMSYTIKLKVATCDEVLFDQANDPFDGQYPVLIYKHWLIPRRYIWQFWCKISQIDTDLSPSSCKQTQVLAELVQNRLSLLSRVNEVESPN